MKTVTFILSCDRSGSTWLGYVLGSHPTAAFLGEFYRAWRPDLEQPCARCAAEGKLECEVLHGAKLVPVESAYDFAFERTDVSHLIDTSKSIEWAQKFTSSRNFECRLVHLIRDPRGWYESQRRRHTLPLGSHLSDWLTGNYNIRKFIDTSGIPSLTVFYDEVAAHPYSELPAVCDFIGMSFQADALAYWNKTHHAFAANGASDPVLRHVSSPPQALSHLNAAGVRFATGDDKYYETHRGQSFVDERWKDSARFSNEDNLRIRSNKEIQRFLAIFGRMLTADGIGRAEPSPVAGGARLQSLLMAEEQRAAALEEMLRTQDDTLNAILQSRGWRALNRYRGFRNRSASVFRTTSQWISALIHRQSRRDPVRSDSGHARADQNG